MTNKRFLLWLALIHLPFFVYQCFSGSFYLSDSKEYLFTAENIFNHFTAYGGDLNLPINPDLYTKRPIGYPLFIGFSFFSPCVLIFFQNVLSIVGISFLRKALVKESNVQFDKWFLILISVSLSYLIYVNMMMSETILAVMVCFMVYHVSKIVEKPNEYKNLLYLSLIIGLAILTKPVFYPFCIVFILLGLFYYKKNTTVKRIAILLIPIVLVFCIHLINKQRTGVAQFSSIQRINLLDYNANYLLVNKNGSDYADRFNDSIKVISLNLPYKERCEVESEAAQTIITNNFTSYIKFHLKGSLRFFVDPGRFDIYHFFGLEKSKEVGFLKVVNESGNSGVLAYLKKQPFVALLLLGISFLFALIRVVLFFLFFNPFRWKKIFKNPVLVFIGVLVFYIAIVTGPLGAARFAVPVVLLINAIGALSMANKLQKRVSND